MFLSRFSGATLSKCLAKAGLDSTLNCWSFLRNALVSFWAVFFDVFLVRATPVLLVLLSLSDCRSELACAFSWVLGDLSTLLVMFAVSTVLDFIAKNGATSDYGACDVIWATSLSCFFFIVFETTVPPAPTPMLGSLPPSGALMLGNLPS